MENKVCLDSDFLIDLLRNKKEAILWLEQNKDKQLFTTSINVFELFYGANKSNKKSEFESCEILFETFPVLEFTMESSKLAGKILADLEKQGSSIDFRDVFIASIVLNNNYSLKTNNKKHFERINGIKLL